MFFSHRKTCPRVEKRIFTTLGLLTRTSYLGCNVIKTTPQSLCLSCVQCAVCALAVVDFFAKVKRAVLRFPSGHISRLRNLTLNSEGEGWIFEGHVIDMRDLQPGCAGHVTGWISLLPPHIFPLSCFRHLSAHFSDSQIAFQSRQIRLHEISRSEFIPQWLRPERRPVEALKSG